MVSSKARKPAAVFLDFEGTLNDTGGTGRLYARQFVARMGREYQLVPEVWVRALGSAMEAIQRFQAEDFSAGRWRGYEDYRRRELTLWAHTVTGRAGLPALDDDQALSFALRLDREIPLEMVPLPGAAEMIAALCADGWRLFIASGAPSAYTRRCLQGVGVESSFEMVYGPDVLDTLKQSPEYFRRAFAHAGLRPQECAVVDDSAGPLAWAVEAGAAVVLAVGEAAAGDVGPGVQAVRNLTELPAVLRLAKP